MLEDVEFSTSGVLISADECISGVIGKTGRCRYATNENTNRVESRVSYPSRQGRCHRPATLRYKSIFPSGGMKRSRKEKKRESRNTVVSVPPYSSHFGSFSCVRCSWCSRVSHRVSTKCGCVRVVEGLSWGGEASTLFLLR